MIYLISINYKWLLSVDQAFCENYTCGTQSLDEDGTQSKTKGKSRVNRFFIPFTLLQPLVLFGLLGSNP